MQRDVTCLAAVRRDVIPMDREKIFSMTIFAFGLRVECSTLVNCQQLHQSLYVL